MSSILRFFLPHKNLLNILRVHVGVFKYPNIKRLLKSVDVYNEPLALVFMLAVTIYKIDKGCITPQLLGVINHERFSNAMTMAAFRKICKVLNDNNIPVLAQKGLVQKILYPSTIRPMNDADFTVPKQFYRKAIQLALNAGFHINHDMLGSADMQYKDQGCIDIHYALFKGANPDMDELIFNKAEKRTFMGCDVFIPSPEDIIVIIMCEFYGNFIYEAGDPTIKIDKIFSNHPQWVLDAYKIIKENPNLNWAKIMRIANMSNYDYQIKILTKVLNKIIPGCISVHARKVIDYMCPDTMLYKYISRDYKIIQLHNKNSLRYYKNLMDM